MTPTYKKASPQKVFGGRLVLQVRNNNTSDYNSFFKFDVASVQGTVKRATLRLYVIDNSYDGGDFFPVSPNKAGTNTPWTESNLNWNNAPAITGTPLGQIGATQVNTWVDVDVTWAVTDAIANQNGLLSLALHNNAGDQATYSSREGANPPQLVIEVEEDTSPPPPPPPPPPSSSTTTFVPTNDAYVQQAKPNKVFGSAAKLVVREASKDFHTFIKFDVRELIGIVDTAKLRLYVTDAGPKGGTIYETSPYEDPDIKKQWSEQRITWANAPEISGPPVAVIGKATAKRWIEVDVTAAVIDAIANQDGRVSLVIVGNSTNQVVYSSRESTKSPELVVTTN
ncbi:MAG: DNRLRE domain-containing protein [Chloroflexota bacterium]